MRFLNLILVLSLAVIGADGNIGRCNLSEAPPSWLSTNATGILEIATAGKPTNGTSFCVTGDHSAKTAHVAYHIDLGDHLEESKNLQRQNHYFEGEIGKINFDKNPQNGCVNNNSRIVYCFALCLNQTLQNMVIDSALKSNQPSVVAKNIEQTINNGWAITVLQVDYNDPNTHLNVSSFLVEDAWCSVYVGIKPKLAFDYLYEIQLGKILSY